MLGKQWLNRYASIDMRGSATERSQNRQRKLDGVIAWYFDHVMESLPLMLQAALLLLGCALSRYLWEIDATVASVVLGVTSFGVLLYLFIVAAGVTFETCPYQTPWASTIRRTAYLLHSCYVLFRSGYHPPCLGYLLFRSAYTPFRLIYVLFVRHSYLYTVSVNCWSDMAWPPPVDAITKTLTYPLALPIAFVMDASLLVFLLGRTTYRYLVDFARRTRGWLFGTTTVPIRAPKIRATNLDFRCISWMLRTSLDKPINVTTLNYLGTTLTLPDLDSTIVVDCFNVLSNCIVISDDVATVGGGSEQLAGVSAACLLRAFSRFSNVEPAPAVIRDVLQRYKEDFPPHINLDCIPSLRVMKVIDPLFALPRERVVFTWRHYYPSTDELVSFARILAQDQVARVKYYWRGGHWLVGFALRFLSQDPLPPTSVVADCLTIVATHLGSNVLDTSTVTPDEKCVSISKTPVTLLILHQYAGRTTFQVDNSGVWSMHSRI